MTASWVILERGTGRVICETFNAKAVAALNTAKYEAVPILKHLQSLRDLERGLEAEREMAKTRKPE